jgi:hypothetical protein
MTGVLSGGIDETKKRLMTLIEEAEPLAHTFGNWRLAMENLYGPVTGLKLPVVTVRISPASIADMVYSRRIPESGDMAIYSFSAHCFASACTSSGEEDYKHAHDLADRIMTHLATRNWASVPHTSYGIVDVFDMNARESEPAKGSRKICRVIIEGTMLVKRIDA